jgi:hypothetical protein
MADSRLVAAPASQQTGDSAVFAKASNDPSLHPVTLAPRAVETWMRAQPHWQRHLTDGLHPDDATYGEIVRQVLMPTLEPLVRAAQARH